MLIIMTCLALISNCLACMEVIFKATRIMVDYLGKFLCDVCGTPALHSPYTDEEDQLCS